MDSSDTFHTIMTEGANNLCLKLTPVSSTSWATFDKDLRTKRDFYVDGIAYIDDLSITNCLSTDCISPYTAGATISAHGNLDMLGYSISGIGNNSLTFQNGMVIGADDLYGDIANPYIKITRNKTLSPTASTVALTVLGPNDGVLAGSVISCGTEDILHTGAFGNINPMIGGDSGTTDIYIRALSDNLRIGTDQPKSITFVTSGWNNTKMTITSGGNVGIGTVTPDEKLTVVGNIYSTETIYASCGNSSDWCSVYTTVCANSATAWNYQGTDLKSLSAGWASTYTTVCANSAAWTTGSTITLTDGISAVTYTNIICSTFVNPITSNGFLIINVNGTPKAIQLYDFSS